MENKLAYQAFMIKLRSMDEEDVLYYIQNSTDKIDKANLFNLCFHSRKVNPTIFPYFFLVLTSMYPLSAINTHVHNITWLTEFQWKDYIDLLVMMIRRDLLTETGNSIFDRLFNTITKIIVEQMYFERYESDSVSNLAFCLPRERKSLDRETKIVKKLAYAYYWYYVSKNKDDEWEDVDHELNIKNKALKLYRQDVTELTKAAKEFNAFDHFLN